MSFKIAVLTLMGMWFSALSSAAQEVRPVIFVHGFCADSSAWQDAWSFIGEPNPSRYGRRMARLYVSDGVVRERETGRQFSDPSVRFIAVDLSWSDRVSRFDTFQAAGEPIFDKARRLKIIIDAVKAETGSSDVLIVGHSMGGLVARAYVQGFAGPYGRDVAAILTLSTPHQGTLLPIWQTLVSVLTGPLGVFLAPVCAVSSSINKLELIPDSSTLRLLNEDVLALPAPVGSVIVRGVASDPGDHVVSAESQDITRVRTLNAYRFPVDLEGYLGSQVLPHLTQLQSARYLEYVHSLIAETDRRLPIARTAGPGGCALGPPRPPSGVDFTDVEPNAAFLTWNEVPQAISYELFAGTMPDATTHIAVTTATSFVARGVQAGVYYVRIRAITACGVSQLTAATRIVVYGPTGVDIDHLQTPVAYDNARDGFGQTFIATSNSIVSVTVYIRDPSRPGEFSVNELQGPVHLALQDVADPSRPLEVGRELVLATGQIAAGLSTFRFSSPLPTVAGRKYFVSFRTTDSFGIGVRSVTASTYPLGAQGHMNCIPNSPCDTSRPIGAVIEAQSGRDLSFRISGFR